MGVQIRALLAWLAYATLAYTQFLRSPRDVRGRPGVSRVTSFGHVQYSVDMGSNSPCEAMFRFNKRFLRSPGGCVRAAISRF